MARALIVVLDSLGIGAAPDAVLYGDLGADTLGHVAQACRRGHCDQRGRQGDLALPNLTALGLGRAAALATGEVPPGLDISEVPTGLYGCAAELGVGKDTLGGHWEIAGLPVFSPWHHFPDTPCCFPQRLVNQLIRTAGLPGVLGECHASGTRIIEELGREHLETLKPILYTSADSVMQIAAHEKGFGLARLYELCQAARDLVDPLSVGRVIARPFDGDETTGFFRTHARRDYSMPPSGSTLLDHMVAAGRTVTGVGKISDIFAGRGISRKITANGNTALFNAALDAFKESCDGSLVFVNLIDFDMLYGHRRDPSGYAAALEAFDAQLSSLYPVLEPGDLVVITGDHGCDPTWTGTDHTREYTPVLAFGPDIVPGSMGKRETFADIGQTLAHWFGLPPLPQGNRFL